MMDKEIYELRDNTETSPLDSEVALPTEKNTLCWDERTWGTNILSL